MIYSRYRRGVQRGTFLCANRCVLLLGSILSSTAFAAAGGPAGPDGGAERGHDQQRCDAYVAKSTALRHALETAKGPSTVATTLAAYDHLVEILGDAGGEATIYREVSPTAASRSAGEKCENRMSSEATKLSLLAPGLRTDQGDQGARTMRRLSYTSSARSKRSSARASASTPPGARRRRSCPTRRRNFRPNSTANIPKGQQTLRATPAELDGLPQDFIDAHKAGANGKITLTTDYTDYIPVMSYAKSRDLRERMYRAFMLRAYPLNEPCCGT